METHWRLASLSLSDKPVTQGKLGSGGGEIGNKQSFLTPGTVVLAADYGWEVAWRRTSIPHSELSEGPGPLPQAPYCLVLVAAEGGDLTGMGEGLLPVHPDSSGRQPRWPPLAAPPLVL